jgi:hypothetical protein
VRCGGAPKLYERNRLDLEVSREERWGCLNELTMYLQANNREDEDEEYEEKENIKTVQ